MQLLLGVTTLFVFTAHAFVSHQHHSRSPYPALFAQQDDRSAARQLVAKGMSYFRQGDVDSSINAFDQAAKLAPSIRPFLWQRGLSLYYADRFREASDQFRVDVQVNPNDVEEIVWDEACLWRLNDASTKRMTLPRPDRRPIMNIVYKLFKGEGSEQELAVYGNNSDKISDPFYADMYLGLYSEAKGDSDKAEYYLKQAIKTEYATGIGRADYMTDIARIHCKLRKWT